MELKQGVGTLTVAVQSIRACSKRFQQHQQQQRQRLLSVSLHNWLLVSIILHNINIPWWSFYINKFNLTKTRGMVGLMKENKVLGKMFHELFIVHVLHVDVFVFEDLHSTVNTIQYNTKSIYCHWLHFGNNRHINNIL